MRRQIMGGYYACYFFIPQCLEVPGGSDMPSEAVPPRKRLIGDLSDEGLNEPVLPPLRRAGISFHNQQLSGDERFETRGNALRTLVGYRCQGLESEGLPMTEASCKRARSSLSRASRREAMRA